jgi:hypothetical protein
MEAIFAKMNETKRRRNAYSRYRANLKEHRLEKCKDINPRVKDPESYISMCDIFPAERRAICETYSKCIDEASTNIPAVPEFNVEAIVPDFKFPLYPGMNINVRQNTLSNYDSTDVLRQIQQIQAEWPWPLDQTTLIVMLGAGNFLSQHLLLGMGVKEVLEERPHILLFNIDPTFTYGIERKTLENEFNIKTNVVGKKNGIQQTLVVNALQDDSHKLWTKIGEKVGAEGPPIIRTISDKFKILDYNLGNGRTLTYVIIKSFANEYLGHSFFWPKGYNGVYKVFLDYLSSAKRHSYKKYLVDNMYDKILTQSYKIQNYPGIIFENNFELTPRGIENLNGGRRRTRRGRR